VTDSSTPDDRDILNKLDKTLGLNYLIGGVFDAYEKMNQDNQDHIVLNISIK
jgi:hypothetical protein